MKVLFLSRDARGLGIANRLTQEHNNVSVFIEQPSFLGGVLGTRVESWRKAFGAAELIAADGPGFGKHSDIFAARGKITLAVSPLADLASGSVARMEELSEKAGLNLLSSRRLDNASGLQEPKAAEPSTWCAVRGTGLGGSADPFICRDGAALDWLSTKSLIPSSQMTVQPYVEGVPVTVEGFFNGRAFVRPIGHFFKDAGRMESCVDTMGILAKRDNRLAESTLLRLTPFLSHIGYHGYVYVVCIVSAESATVVKVGFGFSYDGTEAYLSLVEKPISDVLFGVAAGTLEELPLSTDFVCLRRVTMTPMVNYLAAPVAIDDLSLPYVWLHNVSSVDGGLRFSGGNFIVAKVSAHGRDAREALRRANRTIDKGIHFPGMWAPQTASHRIMEQLPQLHEWGWV